MQKNIIRSNWERGNMDYKEIQSSNSSSSSLELVTAANPRRKTIPAANKKLAGRKILKKTRRSGYGGVALTNPEMVLAALTSHGGNAPPKPNRPDPKQCLPQVKLTLLHDVSRDAHLAAKNFQPLILDAWSPNSSSSSNTRETHVEETYPIDFPSKEEVVEDSLMDYNGILIGFVDEEEMFNMPGLVDSMAEGMLLTPPAMKRGFKWSRDDDGDYINLWGE